MATTPTTNRMRARTAALLAAACGLVAACATGDKLPKPQAAPALIQNPGKPRLSIEESDNGASIVLERTQALIVRLPRRVADSAEWTPVDLRPDVLAVVSGPGFEPTPGDAVSGEPSGLSVWTLRAVGPGSVTLDFALRRPHSRAPALRSARYAVTVK
jgi:hypothetical protein